MKKKIRITPACASWCI